MIATIIEESKTQKVCSLIAQLLTVELTNQLALINAEIDTNPAPERLAKLEFYKDSIPHKTENEIDYAVVYDQRNLSVSGDEAPVLNVVVSMNSLNDLKTVTTLKGDVKYSIEGWQTSPTIAEQRGDTLASKKLVYMLMTSAVILSTKRDLGGLDRLGSVVCSDLIQAQPDWGANNAENAIYGKFDCNVNISEPIPRNTAELIEGSDTTVKLNDTEKGFYWVVNY